MDCSFHVPLRFHTFPLLQLFWSQFRNTCLTTDASLLLALSLTTLARLSLTPHRRSCHSWSLKQHYSFFRIVFEVSMITSNHKEMNHTVDCVQNVACYQSIPQFISYSDLAIFYHIIPGAHASVYSILSYQIDQNYMIYMQSTYWS